METNKKTDEKTDVQVRIEFRRSRLKELSSKAREYRSRMIYAAMSEGNMLEVERWTFTRINDILEMWYKESSGATDFKTFRQWQQEGYHVERGSKAFVLWGRKRKSKGAPNVSAAAGSDEEPQEHEYTFFPIAYVFSNQQVKPRATGNESTATPEEGTGSEAQPEPTPAGGNASSARLPSRFEEAFAA
jgi:hypothetical protein